MEPEPIFYYVACRGGAPEEAFLSLGDAEEWIAEEKKFDLKKTQSAKKGTRRAHLPYSPDFGNTYTTYCGKPLYGLKVIGDEQENITSIRKCSKCVRAKYGDKRPFTRMTVAEVAALMSEKEVTLVVKENCPPEEVL
jgi:hypothetical protein